MGRAGGKDGAIAGHYSRGGLSERLRAALQNIVFISGAEQSTGTIAINMHNIWLSSRAALNHQQSGNKK